MSDADAELATFRFDVEKVRLVARKLVIVPR